MGHSRRFTLSGLSDGIYYWSVQAVDDGFAVSEFAPEQSFVVGQSPQDFHDINAKITGVAGGAAEWVDFLGSNSLDLLLTGRNDRGPFTGLFRYRPSKGDFIQRNVVFENVEASAVDFGDYDNDEDMDLALVGMGAEGRVAKIYRNDERGDVGRHQRSTSTRVGRSGQVGRPGQRWRPGSNPDRV